MKNPPRTVELTTPFEHNLTDVPYSTHPRPQMKRRAYLSLNGVWHLTVRNKRGVHYDGDVTVPFPPESRLSGASITVGRDDELIYSRPFTLSDEFKSGKVILHLDAVDQTCSVYVNDSHVLDGVGGYLPLSCEVTHLLREGENTLTVCARDPMDTSLPYGKQTCHRGGMWYTKISGIWQSVWLEAVPESYVRSLSLTPDLGGVRIRVDGGDRLRTVTVTSPEGELTYSFTGDEYYLRVDSPRLWSPEDPYLYYFTLRCGDDEIESYFALRTFGITERDGISLLALNGQPYYLHGLLDQGYFSDGIFLPATPEGFENDVLRMKSCGFNMLRKHIKLEPDLFYYYCDKHGMIVFQDMINSGRYSFLIDTALPTVGLKRGLRRRLSRKGDAEFLRTAEGIQNTLYNHPSVCYYTIFNEGWGQFDPEGCYDRLRSADPTRVYDTTSGWFKTEHTDVESDHVYFKPVRLKNVRERPMVLSEFGGYSCKIEGHSFNLDKTYGYRLIDDVSSFEDALVSLYEDEVIPHVRRGLSASVLTQLSDVEDETNGLLTYDRQVLKVDTKRMRALSERIRVAFREVTEK